MDNTMNKDIIEAMKKMSKKCIIEDAEPADIFVGDIEVKADTESDEANEVTIEDITEKLVTLPKEKLKDVCEFITSLIEKEAKGEEPEEASSETPAEEENVEHEKSETKEEEKKEEEKEPEKKEE